MMRHQAADPAPPDPASNAEVEATPRPGPPPSLALTIATLVPWAVLIGHAIWLGSLALADGALALAFLMLPWVSFVALSRRWVTRFPTRLGRIGLDLAVLTTCVVLISIGGIWILPGVTAFLAVDVIEPGRPGARERGLFVLGAVVLLAAFPGFLFAFIVWPAALVAIVSFFVPIVAPSDGSAAV